MSALLRQLERVLRRGKLQAQPAELALPAEPPILCCLDLGTPRLELGLRRLGQLTRLRQPPLQRLGLTGRPAMCVARLAPLFPHDAAAQEIESRRRLSALSSGSGLAAEDLQTRLDLRLEVIQPKQVLGQL